ncbi:hypothetical protein EGW08_013108 [Elysia chlorotica]|uniref:Coatomer subunit beta' n=1 Tax=Elysia chlorotica TaxID=188477 RepID=A0A3S1HGX7_ELYCH|nr:hypothetical protein EGW08_013108 [Elysia chlorotica]
MSIKIKVKKKFTSRSQRVKSAELHPTEPWMLTSLYDGNVYIWNTETKKVLKSVLVSDLPVRDAKFVPRKNWFITASDDTNIRVFNYNTAEKVAEFSAHRDYIRSLAVHTSRPFLLSCADDGAIRLWDWEKKWACTQTFRGHVHLVMQVTFNPKDYNQFASASMDKSVKIWQLGSAQPNFSLRHDLGVNCLAYYPGGDKPYIVSGCDGGAVKVWDYQTKSCIQTLLGHAKDVYAVEFHPSMPLILSGASDGTVRMWHASTFKMVALLNFDMGRVWSLAVHKVSNNVAIGFDDGSMLIKLGREEPAISMDMSGKIVWAHHSELQQANVKTLQGQEVKDGEKLELAVKDMGSCEIYPQTIAHSPNGRFMSVCGDGEYTIYTAVALRNKAYGSAHEFVWSSDSSVYATRGGNSLITIYRNFKSHKTFKPNTEADGIFGGPLLGVRSSNCLTFYNWDTTELIRRIEITPTQIYWSEGEDLLTLVSDNSFFILKYNSKAVERFTDNKDATTEDGIEDAFEVMAEFKDKLCTGLWVGDCFIFTNSLNRLNYCIGEEIVTISHLDRLMYLLRYIPKDNRLYLGDKELNIVSFSLLVSVLEYQTAVTRRDFDAADKILPAIPREHRNRVAHFLEKQGFKSQALSVSLDLDHKFELALQLEDLTTAHAVAKQQGAPLKWKQLSDLALKTSQLDLALECLHASQDFGGLLLLATSIGNRAMLDGVELAAAAAGQTNVAFTANFVLGRCDKCLQILLDTNRLPEAALFARTYVPSQVPRVVSLWRERLSTIHRRLGAAIASPAETENMFPEMLQSLKTERFLASQGQTMNANTPASRSKYLQGNKNRNPVEEMLIAEASGTFSYNPGTHSHIEDGDDGHKGGDKGSKSEVEAEDRPVEAAGPIRNENPAKVSTSTSGETDGEATSHVNSSPSQIPTVETNVTEKSLSDINDPVALDEPKENSHDMSLEKSLTLEEELTRDLEGVDLDDFDMDGFELDSDELLED